MTVANDARNAADDSSTGRQRPSVDTAYVHAHRGDTAPGAPVSPPLFMSTTFRRTAEGFPAPHFYSRISCPNRSAFEDAMVMLEHGSEAFAFASGLAASMAVFQTLRPGDHVVIPDDAYYGVRLQLQELLRHSGIRFTRTDMTDLSALRAILREPVALVWMETPSNPLLKVTDIRVVAKLAHACGARVVCDNTWATPVLQQPLLLGCDAVVHSVTKYIGGHSDVLMGCVVVRGHDEWCHELRRIQTIGGAVPSPATCWMASRGMQTLPVRMRAACASAARVAEFCAGDGRVVDVSYPGLPVHPGQVIAMDQMSLPGAMLSMRVRGGRAEALAVAGALKLFAHATSLGGVESLVEHRATVEPSDSGTPENLLRLSIGLEDGDELVADIDAAIRTVYP
ncbi:MAG: trans-sulfuration enzyme family protein [Candidatus Kapaibacterium sp.]